MSTVCEYCQEADIIPPEIQQSWRWKCYGKLGAATSLFIHLNDSNLVDSFSYFIPEYWGHFSHMNWSVYWRNTWNSKKKTVRARELQIPPEAELYLDPTDRSPKVKCNTTKDHQRYPTPSTGLTPLCTAVVSIFQIQLCGEHLWWSLVRSSTPVFQLETAACCLVNCSFERFNKLSMKWCNGLRMTGKCTTEINWCVNVSSRTQSCCWKTADRLKESSKINIKARNKAVIVMTLLSEGALEG